MHFVIVYNPCAIFFPRYKTLEDWVFSVSLSLWNIRAIKFSWGAEIPDLNGRGLKAVFSVKGLQLWNKTFPTGLLHPEFVDTDVMLQILSIFSDFVQSGCTANGNECWRSFRFVGFRCGHWFQFAWMRLIHFIHVPRAIEDTLQVNKIEMDSQYFPMSISSPLTGVVAE